MADMYVRNQASKQATEYGASQQGFSPSKVHPPSSHPPLRWLMTKAFPVIVHYAIPFPGSPLTGPTF